MHVDAAGRLGVGVLGRTILRRVTCQHDLGLARCIPMQIEAPSRAAESKKKREGEAMIPLVATLPLLALAASLPSLPTRCRPPQLCAPPPDVEAETETISAGVVQPTNNFMSAPGETYKKAVYTKADSPMAKAKEETSEASDAAAAKPAAKRRKKKAKKQAKKGDESSHEKKARKARLRGRVIADLPGA